VRTRARLARPVDLALTALVLRRGFDAPDPAAGPREDTQVAADVSLTVDLPHRVGLLVGGALLRNFSTVADFDYLRVTAHLGFVYAWAGPR
jgi:hypothetical protein